MNYCWFCFRMGKLVSLKLLYFSIYPLISLQWFGQNCFTWCGEVAFFKLGNCLRPKLLYKAAASGVFKNLWVCCQYLKVGRLHIKKPVLGVEGEAYRHLHFAVIPPPQHLSPSPIHPPHPSTALTQICPLPGPGPGPGGHLSLQAFDVKGGLHVFSLPLVLPVNSWRQRCFFYWELGSASQLIKTGLRCFWAHLGFPETWLSWAPSIKNNLVALF